MGNKCLVELRVHGVGGSPKESVLGVHDPTDLVRIAGVDKSAFYRRCADGKRIVEGYIWGPLTTGALNQPLWIFLLPITLLNVGGWMLPKRSQYRWPRAWTLARVFVLLLGVSLTLSYGVGLSTIVIKQIFIQWGKGLIESEVARLNWGLAAMAAVGGFVGWVAGVKRKQFEGTKGLLGKSQMSDGSSETPKTLADVGKKSVLTSDESLSDLNFWYRPGWGKFIFWLHVGAGVISVLCVYALGWRSLGPPEFAGPDLKRLQAWLGLIQLGLLFLLAMTYGFLESPKDHFRTAKFRWIGPVVACSTAIGLSGTLFAGLVPVVQKALEQFGGKDIQGVPDLDMGFGYGFGSFAFALTILLIVLFLVGKALVERKNIELPMNNKPAGSPPNGLNGPLALALRRSFSKGIGQLDLALTVPAMVFFPVAATELINKIWATEADPISVPISSGVARWGFVACGAVAGALLLVWGIRRSSRFLAAAIWFSLVAWYASWFVSFGWLRKAQNISYLWLLLPVAFVTCVVVWTSVNKPAGLLTWIYPPAVVVLFAFLCGVVSGFDAKIKLDELTQVGKQVAFGGVGALLAFLIKSNYFNVDRRRAVGILWDVLTFWPRRFHPFGVRPYGEKAVPELLGRLVRHLRDDDREILLSAHSQGSILSYAALSQLHNVDEIHASPPEGSKPILEQANLPTNLCGRISWMTYGSPLSTLHARFFPAFFDAADFKVIYESLMEGVVDSKPRAWRSFYRLTDYVGQVVEVPGTDVNEPVSDPAQAPDLETIDQDPGLPDPFRTPWVDFNLHSHYNAEVQVKNWIQAVRKSVEEPSSEGQPLTS